MNPRIVRSHDSTEGCSNDSEPQSAYSKMTLPHSKFVVALCDYVVREELSREIIKKWLKCEDAERVESGSIGRRVRRHVICRIRCAGA